MDTRKSPTVIFDLDDTLYAREDVFRKAFSFVFGPEGALRGRLPGTAGLDLSALFAAFIRHGYDLYEASMQGRITMEEMAVGRFRRTMLDAGISLTDEDCLAFQSRYLWEQAHLTVSPAMAAALTALRERHITAAIITNGKSDHQRMKYRAMGLSRWIPEEYVLATEEIGVSKPDPRVFQFAQKHWGLSPETAWYVGDSLSHDILPARSVGWHTIWLKRGALADTSSGAPLPGEDTLIPAPEFTVSSEHELLALLRSGRLALH